ncbi:SH3 domain-containing protein [Streptomyces sp. NPDC001903]|uniref:SH3 domain-containing protein n=1 Tax=Streptomyces sp. NPDC001903 TaxID=3364622 RepID=UPI00368474F8
MNQQTLIAMAAVGLGLGLLVPGVPASAAPAGTPEPASNAATLTEAANAHVQGVVVSRVALHVRARATTSATVLGSLDPFEKVQLSCQAKGSTVEGNNIWYRLHGEPGWVSARFVHNYTPVRWC